MTLVELYDGDSCSAVDRSTSKYRDAPEITEKKPDSSDDGPTLHTLVNVTSSNTEGCTCVLDS